MKHHNIAVGGERTVCWREKRGGEGVSFGGKVFGVVCNVNIFVSIAIAAEM